MDLWFVVHNLEKFSSNPDKSHFEYFVHLLRYIRDNKNLGFRYYAKIHDAPLYDLLRQDIINTENQLMLLYDYICLGYLDTGISTGVYIVFIKVDQLIISHMFQV